MSEHLFAFGDEPSKPGTPGADTPAIPTWLVEKLRQTLDALEVSTMEERQQRIEAAVGRPVPSLRALTHQEGLQALSVLGRSVTPRTSTQKSAWDDRDEDTWIDRL